VDLALDDLSGPQRGCPTCESGPALVTERKESTEMSVVENAKEQLLSDGSWAVDPAHSTVEFRVKHMVVQTVTGRFREFEGAIVAGGDPSISGSIGVASLKTHREELDAHLRSPDFFDTDRYPEITFHAGGMQFNGDDRQFALSGELTIKGVTRPITLRGELGGAALGADGHERIAVALRGQLDRSEYGLVWNRVFETGNVFVGDTVDLLLDIAAVRVD
jgi:polyisoprenoid-binding protein YceI